MEESSFKQKCGGISSRLSETRAAQALIERHEMAQNGKHARSDEKAEIIRGVEKCGSGNNTTGWKRNGGFSFCEIAAAIAQKRSLVDSVYLRAVRLQLQLQLCAHNAHNTLGRAKGKRTRHSGTERACTRHASTGAQRTARCRNGLSLSWLFAPQLRYEQSERRLIRATAVIRSLL